ncbi:MAG: Hsp70 family protein [Myxococcota bacterium]
MRHLGIDLGTTNTAAALFDGERVELVRAADGSTLTPSVVRIDARGRITVGSRARAQLERDPDNTRSEFKRLMGTGRAFAFPAAGVSKRPEELAAEVLRAVRHDVQAMVGYAPARAVVTVPALFELPQTAATAEAARYAGFDQVELLQEPVASALAAGWSASDDAGGAWLVYDLGGGTFDVSLLETREGLLRVVGHDGDNFLGGRDIDLALVGWVLEQLEADGVQIDRADPRHAGGLRALRAAAEQAKIDLTRSVEAEIALPKAFELGGTPIDVEVRVDRSTLEAFVVPVVDRSLAVCRRLLEQAGHGGGAGGLRRIVLVGGPTVMPVLRERLEAAFHLPFADGLDPMTLVARGAALYAATAGLDARPPSVAPRPSARRLWLQYPAMTADLSPFVAGRVLDGPGPAPAEVRWVRKGEPGWASDWIRPGADGAVVAMVELSSRRPNVFGVEARDAAGLAVAVEPESIVIVHGLTVSEPPLARSVGVGLADDSVQVYLARGTPLPAKRTFVHHTVDSVAPGDPIAVSIPIVQGEMTRAHLCRMVGMLVIPATGLREALPAGSSIDVTVEVDRSGKLSASALILKTDQVFQEVAHLSIPDADPDALRGQVNTLRVRLAEVRRKLSDPLVTDRLVDAEWAISDADSGLQAVGPDDSDAAHKARRLLIEADAILTDAEDAAAWPELDRRAIRQLAYTSELVSEYGTEQEQWMLTETGRAVERARATRNAPELERHLQVAVQLANAAYYRHPEAWERDFRTASADVSRATDLPRAQQLVAEGNEALAARDRARLRRVVQDLWKLLPSDPRQRLLGYGSGIR